MEAIGRTARALVLEAPRRLVEHSILLPEIGADDGLLRVEACGLCGTDHEEFTGALSPGHAFVPGHETVGVIEAVGDRAAERWGVTVGDRVAVEVFQRCGECESCRADSYRHCRRHGLADMYGFVRVDVAPSLWGGYATHQYLAPDTLLLPVPSSLDPVVATVFNPLGAGIRWGVTVPGIRSGDVVAVLGPGIRGLSVAAAVKEAGAAFVMVTGRGPRDATRLEQAPLFGADLVVDVERHDPVAALRTAVDGLADVVVDVTAKAPSALRHAVALVRPAGTVVLAGTRGDTGDDAAHGVVAAGPLADLIVFKELRVLGALGVDAPAYRSALELLDSGRYPFADLPRRTVGFDGMADLLRSMAGEGDEPLPVHGVLVPGV